MTWQLPQEALEKIFSEASREDKNEMLECLRQVQRGEGRGSSWSRVMRVETLGRMWLAVWRAATTGESVYG